jgi:nitric oxide reductase subunit B
MKSNLEDQNHDLEKLSPWWRNAVILVMIVGFSILIGLTVRAYRDAPPVPEQVVDPSGGVVFTGEDVRAGQQIFLKYGLMENGTIWGHGAYLGPDFSAAYLHDLGKTAAESIAMARYGQGYDALDAASQTAVEAETSILLKQNHYDPQTGLLTFSQPEVDAFLAQKIVWADYFANPGTDAGLKANLIHDPQEIRQLTAFFAWAAWASVADRPGRDYSYTNNFPYDPLVGNKATTDAVLWSALSLIALLGGTAVVLFAFGRFNFLGWKEKKEHVHPQMLPGGETTASQRGTIKYFLIVALLLLAQGLAGALIAHYRADPKSFYGLDLSRLLPSNITRTWHLQTALFWIATSYIAGALFRPCSGGERTT